MRGPRWWRRRALPVLAGYLALSFLLFAGTWRHPMTQWAANTGDPQLFSWYLRWVPYAVTHGLDPFFTHHMNAPVGVNVMWNTSIPLLGLLLAPITLTAGPVLSYNLLATSALALSAWFAFVCIRRYVESDLAAGVGGLLYGFSPFGIAQAHGGHLHLTLALTPPLVLILLDELLVRQRHRSWAVGAVLGAVTGLQVVVGVELLAMEALASMIVVVVLVALRPDAVRRHAPYAMRGLAVALVVFAVLAAGPMLAMFFSGTRPTGSLWSQDTYVSDIYGFVVPTSLQRIALPGSADITARFTDSCCIADAHTYVGVPLLVLLIATAAAHWRRLEVKVTTLLALSLAVLSLGPHLHVGGRVTGIRLPYSWLTSLPVLPNLLVSRLMLWVYLVAGLLVAVHLDGPPDDDRPPGRWPPPMHVAAVVLALAFVFPRLPMPSTPVTIPAFFTSDAVHRLAEDSVVLVAPFAHDTNTADPLIWQAAADMRFRMPEGYAIGPDSSGNIRFLPEPTPLSTEMDAVAAGQPGAVTPQARRDLVAELRRLGVRSVIVGPMDRRDAMVAFFTDLLRGPPERTGGVDVWWDVRTAVHS